jgi:hypothetical protein
MNDGYEVDDDNEEVKTVQLSDSQRSYVNTGMANWQRIRAEWTSKSRVLFSFTFSLLSALVDL